MPFSVVSVWRGLMNKTCYLIACPQHIGDLRRTLNVSICAKLVSHKKVHRQGQSGAISEERSVEGKTFG